MACFPEDAGFPEACFKVSYDYLVLGVGCASCCLPCPACLPALLSIRLPGRLCRCRRCPRMLWRRRCREPGCMPLHSPLYCPLTTPLHRCTLLHHRCRSVNNTFNIEGVAANTMPFKTVEDAARLRLRISECFERAALPQTTPEVRWGGVGGGGMGWSGRGRGGPAKGVSCALLWGGGRQVPPVV